MSISLILFILFINQYISQRNHKCEDLINASKNEEDLVSKIKKDFNDLIPNYEKCIDKLLITGHYKALEKFIKILSKKGLKFREALNNSVNKIQRNLKEIQKEFIYLNAKQKIISPAFQWAQSMENIFIEIKYSSRFDSPGCQEIERIETNLEKHFEFKGECKMDEEILLFKLNLELMEEIDKEKSKGEIEGMGKYKITLKKKERKFWERLLLNKETKIENMKEWFEVNEKYEYETKEYKKKNKEEDTNEDDFQRALNELKEERKRKKKNKKKKKKQEKNDL